MIRTAQIIEITHHGRPEALKIREAAIGGLGDEEVLIQVKAIGLNFADIFERMGLYEAAPNPPFVPGFEVSGVIAEIGRNVKDFQAGQKVIGVTRFGAYTTFLKVDQKFVRHLPSNFSFAQGSGLPTTYLTAYHGLFNLGHLKEREKVLIHAAAGGVGTAALQLAKIFDAEIYATCGSDEKVEFLKSLNIPYIFNYRKQNFETEIVRLNRGGIDLIMDSVGGTTLRQGYRLLNPMGRLIIFGLSSMMPTGKRANWLKLAYQYLCLPRFNPVKMIPENKTMAAFNLVYLFDYIESFNNAFGQILRWAEEGKVKPIIGKIFPFEQVTEAQNFLQGRNSIGKVILEVQ